MAHRAVTRILLGIDPAAEPGDQIAESYTDPLGEKHKVDFERLVELGAAEKVEEQKPARPKAKPHADKD